VTGRSHRLALFERSASLLRRESSCLHFCQVAHRNPLAPCFHLSVPPLLRLRTSRRNRRNSTTPVVGDLDAALPFIRNEESLSISRPVGPTSERLFLRAWGGAPRAGARGHVGSARGRSRLGEPDRLSSETRKTPPRPPLASRAWTRMEYVRSSTTDRREGSLGDLTRPVASAGWAGLFLDRRRSVAGPARATFIDDLAPGKTPRTRPTGRSRWSPALARPPSWSLLLHACGRSDSWSDPRWRVALSARACISSSTRRPPHRSLRDHRNHYTGRRGRTAPAAIVLVVDRWAGRRLVDPLRVAPSAGARGWCRLRKASTAYHRLVGERLTPARSPAFGSPGWTCRGATSARDARWAASRSIHQARNGSPLHCVAMSRRLPRAAARAK